MNPPERNRAGADARLRAAVDDRVRVVIEPAVHACGLVLEGVSVTPAGARRAVRVVVDLPDDAVGGLSLDDVAGATRAIDAALEADDTALGSAPYVLEVGTPGTARPLTTRRHWSRARTRLVTAPVAGASVTGRVVGVDDRGVTLDVAGVPRAVPWSQLGTGRLELEFSRPDEDPDELHDEPDDEALEDPDEDSDDDSTDRQD